MKKFLVLSATVIMATAMAPSAFAHRDANSKAKGDMGGFWTSNNQRTVRAPSVIVRSAQPAAQSYRSFSYVPAPQTEAVTQQPAEVVQQPAASVETSTVQAPEVQPGIVQQYRTFSYQPATVTSQPVRSVKHYPWQYSKADPRRYRH